MRTLLTELEKAAGSRAGIRLLDRQERETFLAFTSIWEKAQRTAAGLVDLGLRPGDTVSLIFPSTAEFFHAFFGVQLAGAIPVPMYPPVRMGRMDEYHARTAKMIAQVDAALVLTDGRIRRLLGRTIEIHPPRLGCRLVADIDAAPRALPVASDGDPGLIQFSSGSTAHPKPVLLTHRAMLANVDAIVGSVEGAYPENDEFRHSGVSWLPLYHDMGLIGGVFPAIAAPRDTVLIPPEMFIQRPALWLRAISKYRATLSTAPNFAYGLCADRIPDADLEGVDLSSWRMALNGAEPVSPATLEKFITRFARYGFRPEALTPVYGLSEAALAVAFSPPRSRFSVAHFDAEGLAEGNARRVEGGRELVSLGGALPGFALQIRDEGGAVLPDGTVGKLWIRGPSLMREYYRMPEATAAVLRDGWLDTGDTGFLSGGELYLHGRAKDLLIIRGRKYAPQALEQLLDEIPGVRVGCSVAQSYAVGGDTERLVILVERAQGTRVDDAALERELRRAIAEGVGLAADEVKILEPGTLPRTSSGKLRRAEALERFRAGTLVPPKPVNAIRIAGEVVRSAVAFARSGRAP